MPDLPNGTVTLLFAPIEGPPHLLEHLGAPYTDLSADYGPLPRIAFHTLAG